MAAANGHSKKRAKKTPPANTTPICAKTAVISSVSLTKKPVIRMTAFKMNDSMAFCGSKLLPRLSFRRFKGENKELNICGTEKK